MAYSFLPNGSIMEVLALLTGLSAVKMHWCLLGGKKRFSFKHKVTTAFHSFHFSCWLWLEGNKYSSSTNQLYAFLQHTLLLSSMSPMLRKLKTWSGKAAKVQGHFAMSVPEAAFYREEKCAVKGQMGFWPLITAAGTGMRQLPRHDVKMQGCFVMGTHVSHKGNLVPTLPASTAFQIRCHVIGRNKHSLPCTFGVSPWPRARELGRGRQTGWARSWPLWRQQDHPPRNHHRPRKRKHCHCKPRWQWQWKWMATNSWAKLLRSVSKEENSQKMEKARCKVWGLWSPRCTILEQREEKEEEG